MGSFYFTKNSSNWQAWLDEAGKLFQVLISLPGRADRVLTILERGNLNIQMPHMNRQVMYLEQSVNRLSGGVIFAALLVGGAILYGSNELYGKIMMGASTLPLLWMFFLARGHRPWR